MATPMKHIGAMTTGQRLAVVYMQLPGKEDHALTVAIDNLPPRFETALMAVLESTEAQAENNLADILARRFMPDATTTILNALHESGMLHRVPVENVVMTPLPNMRRSLRLILEDLGRLPRTTAAQSNTDEAVNKFNPFTANQRVNANENSSAIAHNLLIEADLLEQTARSKREQAFQHAPHLRPAPAAEVAVSAPAKKRRAAAKPVVAVADKVSKPRRAKKAVAETASEG